MPEGTVHHLPEHPSHPSDERLVRDIDASDLDDAEVARLASTCVVNIITLWEKTPEKDRMKAICICILEAAQVIFGKSLMEKAASRHVTLAQQQHALGNGSSLPQVEEAKELRQTMDRHNARIMYALDRAAEMSAQVQPEGLWSSDTERIVEAVCTAAPDYMITTLTEVSRLLKLMSLQLHNSKGLKHDN